MKHGKKKLLTKSTKKELLGDKIEKVLKKVAADKVAAVISNKLDRPCNCGKRREQLNQMHQRFLKAREKRKK